MTAAKALSVAGLFAGLFALSALPCRAADTGLTSGAGPETRLEEVAHTGTSINVTSTGARFEFTWKGCLLVCSQRVPVARDVVVVWLDGGITRSIEQMDDKTCQVEGLAPSGFIGGASLTFRGDSVVVLRAKRDMEVKFLAMFKPIYQAQQKGAGLLMDNEGGFGVCSMDDGSFQGLKRPVYWANLNGAFGRDDAGRARIMLHPAANGVGGAAVPGPEGQKDFSELVYRLKAGQEVWLSIFPQKQPLDAKAFAASLVPAAKRDDPFNDDGRLPGLDGETTAVPAPKANPWKAPLADLYPGNEILRLVDAPAFFQQASLLKQIRNTLEIQAGVYRQGGTIRVIQSNATNAPLPVTLKWDAPGWRVSPWEAKLKPEPGAVAETVFTFMPHVASQDPKLAGAKPSTPTLQAVYEFPGADGKSITVTQDHAVFVNESIAVPRLPSLNGLDAMVDALKAQTPAVLHPEGQGYVETRRPEGGPATEPKLRVLNSEGNGTAEIRLAIAGDNLALHVKALDPYSPADTPQWGMGGYGTGSAIDLYIGRPGSATVRQVHVQLLAPTGEKSIVLSENGKKLGDAEFMCRSVSLKPFGYELQALIPLKDLLLEPGAEQFLVDVGLSTRKHFTLLYTGDPGRHPERSSRHFALAVVAPAAGKPAAP
ncbi:MAG: hypothetical protein NTW19_14440 [Planctomycetota bacterium]|nr:hypothetical protein [Planctomycetota bacterium]